MNNKYLFIFFFSLRVRGQHTKTTGRRGRTVGVSKKK